MTEFEFGQRVLFSNPLVRRQVYPAKEIKVWEDWGRGGPREVTKHINREWQPNQFAAAQVGMVIGKRTLSNGYAEFDNEYGASYGRGYSFPAYLIVADMKSKPVLVRPEDIKALGVDVR